MSAPETIGAIIERWKQRQVEWSKLDVSVKGAPLVDEVLADLESVAAASDDDLNLTDAAQVSGYSPDHLGRMVRNGTLINYGHKGAPRVRRSELPKRAKAVAVSGAKAYDARADARLSLGVRR